MPDVISDAHTINLNQMEDFMEDDVNNEHMLTHHHLLNSPHSPSASHMHNLNNLTNLNINGQSHMPHQNHHQLHNSVLGLVGDPMLSSSSNQHSTVDISCIDPMILNARSLLSTPQPSNCDNNSILQSDSDSLASVDMDTMVA